MANTESRSIMGLGDDEYNIAANRNEVEGEKALLNAVAQGDCEKIEELLRFGICVDTTEYNKLLYYASKNYSTPLQLATLRGNAECVQLLIDHGADVNSKDLFGITALHLAAFNGCYTILKILLRAKADCSLPIKSSYYVPLKHSLSMLRCNFPHLGGTTPLHLAAATNNIDCVKELIRYGADFNAVDEHGRTSLYVAAQLGYSECVLIHLKEAVGRDILSLPSHKTSDTPLHFAVKYHMIDCVKELLNLGSDVNHRNFDGLSPLHTALLPSTANMSDLMRVIELLVLEGYKADINQPDWEGYTPLHYVCFSGYRNMWCRRPEMAKFLIAYGANVNIYDCHKCSLLEQELTYPDEDFDILKYVVKSLLYLPPLKSLKITTSSRIAPPHLSAQLQPPYRNPPGPQNNRDWVVMHREALRQEFYPDVDMEIDPLLSRMSNRARLSERFAMPTVDRANQLPVHRSLAMNAYLYDPVGDVNVNENQNIMEHDGTNLSSSVILKKQLWYEQMSSSPRTLQHHCRFLIRKILGPMKLKYIRKLPIPPIMQSYLLFELNE